jgi:hypothetical protein
MEPVIRSLPVSARRLVSIARHCRLAVAVALAVAGCAPISSRSAPAPAVPAPGDVAKVAHESAGTDLADKGDTACGNPIRFPVTDACVRASEDGTLLQTESDIVMEIWRSCQMVSAKETARELDRIGISGSSFGVREIYETTQQEQADRAAGIPPEPCGVVMENSPACAQPSSPACQAELEADYSCHALRSDPFRLAQKACIKNVMSKRPCVRFGKLQKDSPVTPERRKEIHTCMALTSACDPPQEACDAAKAKLARFYQVRAEWARRQLEEEDKLMQNSQPAYPQQPRHTDCFSNGRFTNCDSY